MNSAVLITYEQDDIIDEAIALCESADYKVKHVMKQGFLQKRKYGLSSGKIQDLKEIDDWIKEAEELGEIAIDTETSSLNPHLADLIGVSLAW